MKNNETVKDAPTKLTKTHTFLETHQGPHSQPQ